MIVSIDYYPFGMLVPNRNGGSDDYRYGFQGQEKDPETGKEAFELRLWDSRIGRWLTTDPYGQYHSPYMAMGNNPISYYDKDGGCADKHGQLVGCDDPSAVGAAQLDEVVLTVSKKQTFGDIVQARNDRYMEIFKGIHRNNQHASTPYIAGIIIAPFAFAGSALLAVEALPLIPSGTIGFSTEGLVSRVAYETTSEVLANSNDLGNVNFAAIGASFFTGSGAEIIGSSVELSFNNRRVEKPTDILVNLTVGKINEKIHLSSNKAAKLIGKYNGAFGLHALAIAAQTRVKTFGDKFK